VQALILAGGEGTRMKGIAAHLPKPLLYLPGGNVLEHQLALLARMSLSHVYVITRHEGRQMEAALDGLNDASSLTQKPPYTLLGALASAEGHIQEACLVIHGDNYFSEPLDFVAEAARTVMAHRGCQGLFVVDRGGEGVDRAARLARSGCYVLSPTVFTCAGEVRDGDELRCLTQALVQWGVGVEECALRGWRQNINQPADLLAVSRRMLENWANSFHPTGANVGFNRAGSSYQIEPPVWVSPAALVRESRLGAFTVVGPGARVENCAVREAILFPGAAVEHREVVGSIVLGESWGGARLSADRHVDRGYGGHPE
jgi:glucose-1-phosphate thymidylyltransferase